ncbi:hypothetical protein [Paenibacillus kobensis]|uniref:hypothetical protein n=1 Tax=Paenibacillus kobensis TaxID=59841 RepID=UPI000FD9C646|nr:hypothetical protein [Paenibacillus kobensis]
MRTKLGLSALFLILAVCVWFAADAARGSTTSGEPSKPASANGQAELEAEAAKPQDASSETTADGLRAVFVRGNALWIKNGSAEQRLTEAQQSNIRIRYPKWSSDDHSIAYTKELNNSRELHIIEADGRNDRVVGLADGYFEWSPAASQLAFVHDGQLSWVEAQSRISLIRPRRRSATSRGCRTAAASSPRRRRSRPAKAATL